MEPLVKKSLTGSEPHWGYMASLTQPLLGAHPANLGGCLSHLHQWVIRLISVATLNNRASRFTVAGQRRIFTELPPQSELLTCLRRKPQRTGVGN